MSSSEARRIRLILEYDGTSYSGWQRQINAPSVQQTLEEKLSRQTFTRGFPPRARSTVTPSKIRVTRPLSTA